MTDHEMTDHEMTDHETTEPEMTERIGRAAGTRPIRPPQTSPCSG